MPIVTEESQPKRRRAHWWALAPALVALLPVGLFAWSWVETVALQVGPYRLVFGAMYGPVSTMGPGWRRFRGGCDLTVELPGRIGIYHGLWLSDDPR